MGSPKVGPGPQFVAQFWQVFCYLLGATVSPSSGHHPQTNRQMERLNQELETGLRCLASQSPNTWSKQLAWVEYAHNSHPCSSSGLYLFQCVYGHQPPLFTALETRPQVCRSIPIPKVINPVAVKLKLPGATRVHPAFHVSQVKPAKESPVVLPSRPPPPPRFIDGGPVYTVRKLLAVRR